MSLTVRELIEKLKQVPNQDAIVNMEGCDCDGYARDVDPSYWGSGDEILITR
jgi:hypothetical protein